MVDSAQRSLDASAWIQGPRERRDAPDGRETCLLLDDVNKALADASSLVLAIYHHHVDIPGVPNGLDRQFICEGVTLQHRAARTFGPRQSLTNAGNSTAYYVDRGQA